MSRSIDLTGGAPVELKGSRVITVPAPQLLINLNQAAEALAVSPRKLWSMTAGGEVPHVRIGRSVRYSVESLREWIEQKSGC